MNTFRRMASPLSGIAAAVALAFSLGGCDRKPSDPPKPTTGASSPAPAGSILR